VEQTNEQLSFDVRPRYDDAPLLAGSLKVSGAFTLPRDLHPGEALSVHIATADGEVIAQGIAEVAGVGFAPVRNKGETIGMERQHKAKLT
jgi:hypothetical protein